jgi:hypothetical protein
VSSLHLRAEPIQAMGSATVSGGSQDKMRAGVWVAAALLVAFPAHAAFAQAAPCSKADFEAVVDEAAGALRGLALENTPQFQARLRQLKTKRGWSDEQFLKEAEPLVRDEKIALFDDKSSDLLARITSAGQSTSAGEAPDCTLLAGLRASMATLVETQKAKWSYMFDKIDGELRK